MRALTAAVCAALLSLSAAAAAQTTGGGTSPSPAPITGSPPSVTGAPPASTPGTARPGTTAPVVPSQCVGMIGEQRERCVRQYGAGGTGGTGSPSAVTGGGIGGSGASAPPPRTIDTVPSAGTTVPGTVGSPAGTSRDSVVPPPTRQR